MAELLCQRDQLEWALDLLATALENQPPKAGAADQVRVPPHCLRKTNPAPAQAQLKPIWPTRRPRSAPRAIPERRSAIQQKDWPKRSSSDPFRDQIRTATSPASPIHALMRLVMPWSIGPWEQARQVYETVVGRFAQSDWIDNARFEVGWCNQNQKRYDQAVGAYGELVHRAVPSLPPGRS